MFSSESVPRHARLSPDDLNGTHFSDYIHEEDAPAFSDTLARLDTHRRTATGIVARWRHADGEYRWLEGNLLALIGRDGTVTGFRGTHRDVTERKQQQERIARLTRMLQLQSGINAAVVRIRDRDALLREACRLAMQVGGYEHAMVSMVDARTAATRVPWYWNGGDIDTAHAGGISRSATALEPDTSLVGRALRTGEITVCDDLVAIGAAGGEPRRAASRRASLDGGAAVHRRRQRASARSRLPRARATC